jgi:predicted transcriptional regulator
MEKVGAITVETACHKDIGKTDLIILIIISAYQAEDNKVAISQAKLAELIGTQRTHINRSIKKLLKLKLIKTKRLNNKNKKSVLLYSIKSHVPKMIHTYVPEMIHVTKNDTSTCTKTDTLLTSSSSPTSSKSLKDKGVEKTKSVIEDDWLPNDDLIQWAFDQDPNLDVRLQTEKFINYHQRKDTKRTAWDLSWKYWMNHAGEYSNDKSTGSNRNNSNRTLEGTENRRAGLARSAARAEHRRSSSE